MRIFFFVLFLYIHNLIPMRNITILDEMNKIIRKRLFIRIDYYFRFKTKTTTSKDKCNSEMYNSFLSTNSHSVVGIDNVVACDQWVKASPASVIRVHLLNLIQRVCEMLVHQKFGHGMPLDHFLHYPDLPSGLFSVGLWTIQLRIRGPPGRERTCVQESLLGSWHCEVFNFLTLDIRVVWCRNVS